VNRGHSFVLSTARTVGFGQATRVGYTGGHNKKAEPCAWLNLHKNLSDSDKVFFILAQLPRADKGGQLLNLKTVICEPVILALQPRNLRSCFLM
jgi:hypothetical protein